MSESGSVLVGLNLSLSALVRDLSRPLLRVFEDGLGHLETSGGLKVLVAAIELLLGHNRKEREVGVVMLTRAGLWRKLWRAKVMAAQTSRLVCSLPKLRYSAILALPLVLQLVSSSTAVIFLSVSVRSTNRNVGDLLLLGLEYFHEQGPPWWRRQPCLRSQLQYRSPWHQSREWSNSF